MSELKTIAHIHTDFPTKFGVPRQSGLVSALKAEIVFCPEYRDVEAFRGITEFSHIWLLWSFSKSIRDTWSPTVRPPRLGGEERMGVFATRSPFRPNAIGLSSVKLEGLEIRKEVGPVLIVSGADLMDQTPIFDIKPYIAYADSHPEAVGGFTSHIKARHLEVSFPDELLHKVPKSKRESLLGVLAEDPRPRYHKDEERVYGMGFAGLDIKFRVVNDTVVVVDVLSLYC